MMTLCTLCALRITSNNLAPKSYPASPLVHIAQVRAIVFKFGFALEISSTTPHAMYNVSLL